MESYKRYATYGICISVRSQFCYNTFFCFFNLVEKWFSVEDGDEKENLLTVESEALSGQDVVPKKDVLNNKYVTCVEDMLDKCVMCLVLKANK